MMKKALLPMLFVLSWGSFAAAEVWTATRSWSASAEADYQSWVRSSWNASIFAQDTLDGEPNPFKGMRADCADTVYAMRMIFAYVHKLPFAMRDASRGTGLITNKMSRWDGQSGPRKARALLDLIFQVGSTQSLPSDTYPVALDRSGVTPGTLILASRESHHSWTIKNVNRVGAPHLVFNSVNGRASRLTLQERFDWPSMGFTYKGTNTSEHAAIRAFRPISYIGRNVSEVPGYSRDQYGVKNPFSIVMSATRSRKESPTEKVERLMADVCADYNSRIGAVRDALIHQGDIGGRCMNASDYDNYSSPSRDQRSLDSIKNLRAALKAAGVSWSALNGYCRKEYRKGVAMDLAEYAERFLNGQMNSNPNESGAVRWGEKRASSSCPKY